ncbi:MAG: DoxX family protein [Bacteroidota bacterium]
MKVLTQTNNTLLSISLLLLRITAGTILFVAGAGKVFGWFGGMGLEATLNAFSTYMGISAFWAYVSSFAELIGGFLLVIGLLTRPAAFVLTINMLVAVILVGTKNFFLPGGGAYAFVIMIGSLIILLAGPMSYSLDALLTRGNTSLHKEDIAIPPN